MATQKLSKNDRLHTSAAQTALQNSSLLEFFLGKINEYPHI